MGKDKKSKSAKAAKQQNGADVKRLFKVLGLSLLIVFLLIAVVSFIFKDTPWNLLKKNKTADTTAGIISRIDADSVKAIHPYENGVVMLTNSALQYLDSTGRLIESNKHLFASPEMQVFDKTVFLYDKGGTGCRIEKNASVYREITADGAIMCGTIGKKGNYAFSLDNHGGYQSHIFVYSFNGDKLFEWGSASDYCFRMTLSDTGNRLAVCVIGVQNAEYYSRVMLFSFNSGQPVYTVDFPGKTVFDLDFIAGKRIAVYTDSGVYEIDTDGRYSALQEYSTAEIAHSCVNSRGLSTTAIIPYGNEQAPLVTVFDENHKQIFTQQYNTLISGVVCSDDYVGVVMFDRVQILNKTGKVLGDIVPGETCERYVIVNNHLFVLTGTGLHRFNIHFDTEKAESASSSTPKVSREETAAPDPSSDIAAAPAEETLSDQESEESTAPSEESSVSETVGEEELSLTDAEDSTETEEALDNGGDTDEADSEELFG